MGQAEIRHNSLRSAFGTYSVFSLPHRSAQAMRLVWLVKDTSRGTVLRAGEQRPGWSQVLEWLPKRSGAAGDWGVVWDPMKSFLYHAFGVKGYRYLRTRYEDGEIIFDLEPEDVPTVPEGGRLVRRGFRWRKVRAVSIGLKPVWLNVKIQRWENTATGEEFEQPPPLSMPTRRSRANSGA
jgi:hypothetical protein